MRKPTNHFSSLTRYWRVAIAALVAVPLMGLLPLIAADTEGDQAKVAESVEANDVVPNQPAVAGQMKLNLRVRLEAEKGSGKFHMNETSATWDISETAIIICDMWNGHYCQLAAERVATMAPRTNEIISAARAHGVTIIHAPSGTMDQYEATPHRKRMQQAVPVEPPIPLKGWCYLDLDREATMPVDVSNCACDDPVVGPKVRRFSRQHDAIKIIGYDGISDRGDEIYSFCQNRGIKNIVLMGVHTNMCVLGRPFGIRQMVRVGMNVVLARDLTDAMYDPREYPYVSHTRGTELVVEHIEKYWCPSILSEDLTKVIPGSADPDPEVIRSPQQSETAKRESLKNP